MTDITCSEPPVLNSWEGVPALVTRYARFLMRRFRNRMAVGIEARPGAPGTGIHHYLIWGLEVRRGKPNYQLLRTMSEAAVDIPTPPALEEGKPAVPEEPS